MSIREDLTLRQLYTNLSRRFQDVVRVYVSPIEELVMRVPSNSEYETYGWMSEIPQMREWIGPRAFKDLSTHSYKVYNKPYELSVRVLERDFRYGRIASVQSVTDMVGRQVAAHPMRLVINLLKNGHLSSATSFDGQNFFDTDHAMGDSGSQSNYYASGKALNEANYSAVRMAMMGIKSETGDPLGVNPNLLIVPPALEPAARAIVDANAIIAGVAQPYRGTARILVVPELAGQDTTWYLVDTSFPLKPLILQEAMAPRFVTKTGKDDDPVFYHGQCEFGADAEWGPGYAGWPAIVKAAALWRASK
jgi:phage major head subunit gpT-like protein